MSEDALTAPDAGNRAIRGGGLRAIANVVGVLTGAISAPLVVRHLGVSDYGRLALVNSILFVATAVSEGGLGQVALRRYTVADEPERRALIAALIAMRLVLTAAASVLVLAFGALAGYPGVVIGGIALAMIALASNVLAQTVQTDLLAKLRLPAIAGIEMLKAVASTAFFLVLVLAGTGLGPFYVVGPAASLLAFGVSAWVVRRNIALRPRLDRVRIPALARETALYAAATALGSVYFQLTLVITSLLTGDHETGLYAIAFRIIELANTVPWILAASVFPILAHASVNDQERLRYAVGRVTEVCLLVGGLVLVVIVLGARFGIDFVAGSDARAAVGVLRITAIGAMATYLVAAWSLVLASEGRFLQLLRLNAIAFAAAIALALILVPTLGARGAGASTATLEILLAALYGWALHRSGEGMLGGLKALPKVGLALLLGFAAGLPLIGVNSALSAAVGVAVYAGAALALRAVPPEIFAALRRRA